MDFLAAYPAPMLFIPIIVFGLIAGSFLNVVILRWNTGMSIAKGRSACFSCGAPLRWYELIPVASFIIQRGACRRCGAKISWQYPLVEVSAAAAFAAAALRVPEAFSNPLSFASFVLVAALLCFYIVIVAYDLRHKIIPDFFSYAAAFISLGLIGMEWAMTGNIDPYRAIAGLALFLFFWFFWKISKGRWMGLGDGKLALSIGWALGLSQGISALLLSFWIGAAVSLAAMAFQRLSRKSAALGMRSEIPFGPFLVIGFLIVFLWGIDAQAILSHLAV
ncbi:prepilin peptidase [Candidatus Parcubacteria bacterium]|nr:prepilin peptidase [Candidatus Parcubacteria bacterium]